MTTNELGDFIADTMFTPGGTAMYEGPYYRDDNVTLYAGDCLDKMKLLADNSVDAVVTDPPYGLQFMQQTWDRPWAVSPTNKVGYAGRENNLTLPTHGDNRNANCRACGGRQRGAKRCECAAPRWDRDPADDMREYQAWCRLWAQECLRVLKPGGHMLCFGGTRTFHRLTCGVEDAGFEIRDSIAWLYGSGFPKSLDVSKAIDRAAGAEREVVGRYESPEGTTGLNSRDDEYGFGIGDMSKRLVTAPATDAARTWQGWGTALKPAMEIIVVARKPLASGTVAGNVLVWGTGALNIDACRVATSAADAKAMERANTPGSGRMKSGGSPIGTFVRSNATGAMDTTAGRWPPNVALDATTADMLDKQSGTTASRQHMSVRAGGRLGNGTTHGHFVSPAEQIGGYDDSGGASRFFPVFLPVESEPCGDESTKAANTSAGKNQANNAANLLTDGHGNKLTDRSHPVTKSTTATRIHSTTTSTTSCALPQSGTTTTASDYANNTAGSTVSNNDAANDAHNGNQPPLSLYDEAAPSKATAGIARGRTAANGPHETARYSTLSAAQNAQPDSTGSFPTFKYTPKAPGHERPSADGVNHPTVKPLELMRWLVRLVTPPGGTVLDPFAGTGTTGEACILEHKHAILIEREPTYLPLIVARLHKPMQQGFDFDELEEELF